MCLTGCICPNGSLYARFRERSTPRRSSSNAAVKSAESPFAFSNRTFSSTFNPPHIVTPNESSIIGYNFYLPRIDKVVLDSNGDVVIITGESSTNPTPISVLDNAMVLATIELPAYLYDPDDAKVIIEDNVRFTMKDISKLEDRIETVSYTHLTLPTNREV